MIPKNQKFKSTYADQGGYSFLVEWETKRDVCRIETRSRSEALNLCSNLKRDWKTVCYMIECATGRKIKKLA